MKLVFFSILDMIKTYFEENPLPVIKSEQFDSNFIIEGLVKLTKIYC